MKLRVTYERPDDVVTDHEQQFARGGLLVRVDPPSTLEQRAVIELELVTPYGTVELKGEALQVFPGVGVAVGFDPGSAELQAIVESARRASGATSEGGAEPEHSIATEPASSATPARPAPSARSGTAPAEDALTRIKNASTTEKMRIARQGSRDERSVIMRDPTLKHLHQFVVRNPHVQLDEISQFSRMTTASAEVYTFIANQPDWAQRPEIALALVRNPKVPIAVAIKMLNNIPVQDLRQITKANNIREAVRRAARKKIL